MDNKIKVIEKETQDIIKQAENYIIKNQLQYNNAGIFLKSIKGLQKQIKNTFDPLCKKAQEAHKSIVAEKKKHLDPVNKAEQVIKEKQIAYWNEQETKRKAEQERLARDAEKKGVVAPVIAPSVTKLAGQSIKKIWKVDSVDIKQLPKEWCLPNMSALNAHARNTKGKIPIPGVVFKEETSMSMRI